MSTSADRLSGKGHLGCEVCAAFRDPDIVVQSSDCVVAFVPERQQSHGEIVVAPRRHVASILLLDEAELDAVVGMWTIVQRTILQTFRADGITASASLGELAQQSWLGHYSIDVAPRYKGVRYTFLPRSELPLVARNDRTRQCVRAAEGLRRELGRASLPVASPPES